MINRIRPKSQDVERPEDMSLAGRLQIHWCDDGDIHLTVFEASVEGNEVGNIAGIEFCSSGGQSEETYWALLALMAAMEKDNKKA